MLVRRGSGDAEGDLRGATGGGSLRGSGEGTATGCRCGEGGWEVACVMLGSKNGFALMSGLNSLGRCPGFPRSVAHAEQIRRTFFVASNV